MPRKIPIELLSGVFELLGFFSMYIILQNLLVAFLISILFLVGSYLKLTEQVRPIKTDEKYFTSDTVPNCLLELKGREVRAAFAIRILSMPFLEDYNRLVELQQEFSIHQSRNSTETKYWIYQSLPLVKPWEQMRETEQLHCLKQFQEHCKTFQKTLYHKLPGIQVQPLSVLELQNEMRY